MAPTLRTIWRTWQPRAGASRSMSVRYRTRKSADPRAGIETGLGHRVYRGDRMFGFWDPEVLRLERGDMIVEVVPRL
jgi:hypothetical protein